MAKSKGFFSLRTGSTKSLTFSVLNGKQITKDRVEGGKNPRSVAQMIQRMSMATASAAYAGMKQIVDHSFEGYSYGANNMARFLSLNVKAVKDCYVNGVGHFGFNSYGDRQLKQGSWIMSQGTASPISTTHFNTQRGDSDLKINLLTTLPEGGVLSPNLVMETLGVKVGDMATLVMVAPLNNEIGNTFIFVRYKFKAASDNGTTSNELKNYIEIESNMPIGSIEVAQGGIISVTLQGVKIDNAQQPNVGVIHSVKSADGWLRSNVVLSERNSDEYPDTPEVALASYPVGETYILNGGDING